MKEPMIAAYYFPNYHTDPYNETYYGSGWNEWKLMKEAKARFENHEQPKIPLWGYQDESDPVVMEQKIDAAVEHGLDCFIFDAYYYDNNITFLNGCLDRGFLKATNNKQIQFALMWANHTWTDIHPYRGGTPKVRFDGKITWETFEHVTQQIIDNYMICPNYFRIDGKAYFSFYEYNLLKKSLGGKDAVNQALKDFRARARAKVGELHLNFIVGEISFLPGEDLSHGYEEINDLDIDSVTSYTWLHHHNFEHFPTEPYRLAREQYTKYLPILSSKFEKTYYPNVSVGWDSSPRTDQGMKYEWLKYPFTPILSENTPEEFGLALEDAAVFSMAHTSSPIVIINAWNEWTEGSYLEPDTVYRYGYLEKIREVKQKLRNRR